MSKRKATTTDTPEQAAPEPAASPAQTIHTGDTVTVNAGGSETSAFVQPVAESVTLPEHMRGDPYWHAIQEVLADPSYDHRGAHHTELLAIRKLVERGHDEAEAEREVRRRLY